MPRLDRAGTGAEPNNPGLSAVIEGWDRLREAIRAGIVELVRAPSVAL